MILLKMKIVNYNYQHTVIYKLCKSMLMKKHCKILLTDKKNGIIHAKSRFHFFQPSFSIHIHSEKVDINQTKLSVDFIPKNTNKRSSTIQDIEETKFIDAVNYFL